MNRYKFHAAVREAMSNYAHTYVSDRGVKKSYLDVYPMSWDKPKEDCGYGGVIKTLYIADGTPLTKRDILIALGKKTSSFSDTFSRLRAAGLINNVFGNGYGLTELGEQYAHAWLETYLEGDDEDAEDNTQHDEVISNVAQSIKCCAAAIGCVAKTIGNDVLGSSVSALQKSVDELMKSL